MPLLPRPGSRNSSDTSASESTGSTETVSLDKSGSSSAARPGSTGKGHATPKRRESEGRRGPVSAPRTRKEAYARQRQLDAQSRRSASAPPTSTAERRAAMRRGDPAFLPRRDQGETRALARDYVDSRRMLSNYLLILFPLLLLSYLIPYASAIVLILFLGFVVEWVLAGRRIRAIATERHGRADGSAMSIGLYAGTRAYQPRRWRQPRAQKQLGDEI